MLGAGNREYLVVQERDIVTAATAYYIPIPEKCVVTKIWSAIDQAITGDLTITAKIGGVAITGGAITVTAASSAAGDVDSAVPTALNSIAAGGTLEIEFNANPSAGGTCVVLIEISKGVN